MVTQQTASSIETIVEEWLKKRKIQYEPQAWLRGGAFELGGAIVDFLVEPNLAWRIQGRYWHRGVTKAGSDAIQREILTTDSWVVVDIWEDDIKNRLEDTLTKALQGEEQLQ